MINGHLLKNLSEKDLYSPQNLHGQALEIFKVYNEFASEIIKEIFPIKEQRHNLRN